MNMSAFTEYTENRIVALFKQGKRLCAVVRELNKEGIYPNRSSVAALIKRYKCTGSTRKLPGGRPPKKVTPDMIEFIDAVMMDVMMFLNSYLPNKIYLFYSHIKASVVVYNQKLFQRKSKHFWRING